jgi:hypothetical protein
MIVVYVAPEKTLVHLTAVEKFSFARPIKEAVFGEV